MSEHCCGAGPGSCAWNNHPSGYHCRGGAYGGCGQTFGGLTAFDEHRKGDARCWDPKALGMERNANGLWGHPLPEGVSLPIRQRKGAS